MLLIPGTKDDVFKMQARHANDLGGCFALGPEQFFRLATAEGGTKQVRSARLRRWTFVTVPFSAGIGRYIPRAF
jgi:hypothetical protein